MQEDDFHSNVCDFFVPVIIIQVKRAEWRVFPKHVVKTKAFRRQSRCLSMQMLCTMIQFGSAAQPDRSCRLECPSGTADPNRVKWLDMTKSRKNEIKTSWDYTLSRVFHQHGAVVCVGAACLHKNPASSTSIGSTTADKSWNAKTAFRWIFMHKVSLLSSIMMESTILKSMQLRKRGWKTKEMNVRVVINSILTPFSPLTQRHKLSRKRWRLWLGIFQFFKTMHEFHQNAWNFTEL